MSNLTIEQLLTKHGIDVKSGVWVHAQSKKTIVLHKALEQLAIKMGITFGNPQFVAVDQEKEMVALWVTGYLPGEGDAEGKTEWSFGEATPKNNKNPYPFAMAEKRAKDRVVLKLIGVHGEVYSDVEADDFKKSNNYQTKATKSFSNKSSGVVDPFASY